MDDFFPIFWFPHLFGIEEDPKLIKEYFDFKIVDKDKVEIYCKMKERTFKCGRLLSKSFSSFHALKTRGGGKLHIVCGNGEFSYPPQFTDFIVAQNHPDFNGATFQIGSSAKAIQNADSNTSAIRGISDYAFDTIQGTIGSVATAQAALYRNYLCSSKMDLLDETPFVKKNGFVLIDEEEAERLKKLDFDFSDFNHYKIAIQRNCEVVLRRDRSVFTKFCVNECNDSKNGSDKNDEQTQMVHQVFCVHFDFKNDIIPTKFTKTIVRNILEAQYRMTIMAAWENSLLYPNKPGSKVLFLTPLGSRMGTSRRLIAEAVEACKDLIIDSGLEVYFSCPKKSDFDKCESILKEVVEETDGNTIITKQVTEDDLSQLDDCQYSHFILWTVIICLALLFGLYMSKILKF
ncbi:hypothetical protein TRFO_31554 [Tritrichomonas foetus]|uniref:Uncharacterized protein n=1 Tax=Tritrichomonas foetus TaxID=1144522 RepID=A0A1J4JVL0_9EUKA|nr:hypothetical protein TRFO_31554 [Tritrichomonas foetus]|eukprot:OHT01572.1 hypothetical protein TRFO_31554 [Tritrichomonas foetus]